MPQGQRTNAEARPQSRPGKIQLHLDMASTYYGQAQALKDICLTVNEDEVVTILGSNGAGKTTLLNSITGLVVPRTGKIVFKNKEIQGMPPHRIIRQGVASVPEGRQLFGAMSVGDNLLLGAYILARGERKKTVQSRLDMVFSLFPILEERLNQQADTMSGGQQQMLAVGRALMANPTLLALDEPSLGLSPLLVGNLMTMMKRVCGEWRISVLLVEQNARAALKIADYVYVLERGAVVHHDSCGNMIANPAIQAAYLGG